MATAFTKMHGLGNDFVVFDGVRQRIALTPDVVRRLADRRFGIGCDQVLLVEPPGRPGIDFRYRIFNSDGGEVEQCGNGARCFARFVRDHGLSDKNEIAVETMAGVIYPRIEPDGQVSVNMGVPEFNPAKVPFNVPHQELVYNIDIAGQPVAISVVSMGNPHAVQIVPDVDTAPVASQGPLIEKHPQFPRRVNAGFAQILDRTHIRVRVYERGAGETLACGTGACAAVAVLHQRGLVDSSVTVELRGGRLHVEWPGEGASMTMTGPVATVFEGTIELDRL